MGIHAIDTPPFSSSFARTRKNAVRDSPVPHRGRDRDILTPLSAIPTHVAFVPLGVGRTVSDLLWCSLTFYPSLMIFLVNAGVARS